MKGLGVVNLKREFEEVECSEFEEAECRELEEGGVSLVTHCQAVLSQGSTVVFSVT